tara:strand:+ start:968 stop:1414 length:447 start_codon:yes stop_codon:yes gene_type:complete
MYIFSSEYRNGLKKRLVNYLYDYYLSIKNDKYSDDLVAFTIKCFHMIHPVNCLLFIFMGSKVLAISTFISVLFVLLMFIYLNGCFLSSLEYKINKQDITIADPIIMLCNDEITPKNRIFYSIFTISLYIFLAFLIILYRFYMPLESSR